jgi:cytoskeleton protein RodZ
VARQSKTTTTIGAELKAAREARGLNIESTCDHTKIHPRILRALESDEVLKATSLIYARSFLRMYAKFLELNVEELLTRFQAQCPKADAPSTIASVTLQPIPTPAVPLALPEINLRWLRLNPQRRMLAVRLVVIGVVVWGTIGLIQRISHRAPTAAMQTGVMPSVRIPVEKDLELRIEATENAWLNVVADDQLLFQDILKKHQSKQWTAKKALVLWVGNAGGVELTLNGQALGAPGERKEIIRKLTITHQGIQREP